VPEIVQKTSLKKVLLADQKVGLTDSIPATWTPQPHVTSTHTSSLSQIACWRISDVLLYMSPAAVCNCDAAVVGCKL